MGFIAVVQDKKNTKKDEQWFRNRFQCKKYRHGCLSSIVGYCHRTVFVERIALAADLTQFKALALMYL